MLKNQKPSDIVRESYNQMGHLYHQHRDVHKIDDLLEKFTNYLPTHAKILDAGAGAGVPGASYLAKRGMKVTGIDISGEMLKLARKNVPAAEFLEMDMRRLNFAEETFDGVMSLFALFHVPRQDHFQVFREFFRVLRPGGVLMINTGTHESEGYSRFFGENMFWSNLAPSTTLQHLQEIGFSILFEGGLARGGEVQYWVFAQKA